MTVIMKHVPNTLTMLRILMIPIFIWLFFNNTVSAASIFLLACVTDIIDGYLARKYNVVSKFGMLFDPLADKLLQISAMVCLYISDVLSFLVVVIVIFKEIVMMCGALYLLNKDIIVPANKLGKLSTIIAATSILYLIAVRQHTYIPSYILSLIIIISTLGTLIGYIFVFIKKLED